MKKQRKTSTCFANRVTLPVLVWLVIFAIITAAGGVSYTIFKNDRTTVQSEIRRVNSAIAENNMRINEYRTKISTLTNRWNMLGRLDTIGSDLRDIAPEQIQQLRISQGIEPGRATAAR